MIVRRSLRVPFILTKSIAKCFSPDPYDYYPIYITEGVACYHQHDTKVRIHYWIYLFVPMLIPSTHVRFKEFHGRGCIDRTAWGIVDDIDT